MYYYQFNIGDYLSHTRHLTPTEDLCYRRLLDYYYLHEKPILLDLPQATRLLCLNKEFIPDVQTVLTEFFIQTDNGWINPRADKEIKQYQGFIDAGKLGAAKRWSKDTNNPPNAPLKQPPMLNTNQQPITNKQIKLTATKVACPTGVSLNTWNDYLTLRKSKKLPITETALSGITREAEKAGLTLQETIVICCERGWGGFKAEWLKDEAKKAESQAWRTDDNLMLQKARELGISTTGKQRFQIIADIDKKKGNV
jgi:uncharacterized protein YdaU (DUF1376 family)